MGFGHFGLGRFGLDSSASGNAKGGRFGHNRGVCMHKSVMHFLAQSYTCILYFSQIFISY